MADSKTGLRCAAAALAVLALAGCSGKKAVTCQGYVEGEFIYVAAGEGAGPRRARTCGWSRWPLAWKTSSYT